MNENPYQSPLAPVDSSEISAPFSSGRIIGKSSWLLFVIAVRICFRFAGVAFVALVLLIHIKGTPINWTNVRPALGLVGFGCLLTHLIPLKSTRRWVVVATGARLYLAACALAAFVFVNRLYPAGM